jgi:hypothetical protein
VYSITRLDFSFFGYVQIEQAFDVTMSYALILVFSKKNEKQKLMMRRRRRRRK